jgi:hypothetical protein
MSIILHYFFKKNLTYWLLPCVPNLPTREIRPLLNAIRDLKLHRTAALNKQSEAEAYNITKFFAKESSGPENMPRLLGGR